MPLTAAASAREILVRLHDVMAARSSAQAKLDAVARIEARQTVAMVLSELIAKAGLMDQRGDAATRPQSTAATRLEGLKLDEGMAIGHAVYHQPRITIEHTVAEDTEAERHRVYAAF